MNDKPDWKAIAEAAWNAPGWTKAAQQYASERPAAPKPRPRATPASTIEALLYCVRERGIAALKEPANVERLSRCDAAAKAKIETRIAKFKSKDSDS